MCHEVFPLFNRSSADIPPWAQVLSAQGREGGKGSLAVLHFPALFPAMTAKTTMENAENIAVSGRAS